MTGLGQNRNESFRVDGNSGELSRRLRQAIRRAEASRLPTHSRRVAELFEYHKDYWSALEWRRICRDQSGSCAIAQKELETCTDAVCALKAGNELHGTVRDFPYPSEPAPPRKLLAALRRLERHLDAAHPARTGDATVALESEFLKYLRESLGLASDHSAAQVWEQAAKMAEHEDTWKVALDLCLRADVAPSPAVMDCLLQATIPEYLTEPAQAACDAYRTALAAGDHDAAEQAATAISEAVQGYHGSNS